MVAQSTPRRADVGIKIVEETPGFRTTLRYFSTASSTFPLEDNEGLAV